MENSTEKEWSPNQPVPHSEWEAYRDKISEMMKELDVEIQRVAKEPFDEKNIWARVGDLRYGHPTTPLLLRYKALMWFHMNPPDPRGEPMYSRPGPYKVYVDRAEFMELLERSARTIDRMLATIRKAAFIKQYEKITVEKFCFLNTLPEEKIQQQLHEIFLRKWNKYKKG
jgi:hypothetical protein